CHCGYRSPHRIPHLEPQDLKRISSMEWGNKAMRKVSLIALAILWGGWLALPVAAQEAAKTAPAPASTVPTIDQSLEWQSVFNPKISPDRKSTRLNSSHGSIS